MANDYTRKTRSPQDTLKSMVSGRFLQIDGGTTTPISVVPAGIGCSLIRVVLNTNGATLNVKSGSRQIANIASDAPEGDFDYGVYCENGLTVQASGAGDWTIVYDR